MTPELLIVKGVISELPPEELKKVMECRDKYYAVISEYGDLALIALSLVAVEL